MSNPPVYFVSLITRDNRPLHIQSFSPFGNKEETDLPIDKESKADASLNSETGTESVSSGINDSVKTTELTANADDLDTGDKDDSGNNATDIFGEELNTISLIQERKANEFLKYNFLSNMALDIFLSNFFSDSSSNDKASGFSNSNTSKLLFVQDGISVYGYESNTGLKIVIGTSSNEISNKNLDLLFKNIHKAYLGLICNPFQSLDEKSLVTSKNFEAKIKCIVDSWNAKQ
ncbi:Tca17p [Ascoidea rubescens DSM 1968]|uniref:Snare-like protein n=1 Tax=Ascoidea rubescens DSM 1968 TaxID=1344418 RepID=A0A1D2VCY6_9ASCO|nr:snare-like protein [Ascoidea rubescens DSM 1968]ODV59495.1 snare-like protein [Ascoidea rubescens DSM 1968]